MLTPAAAWYVSDILAGTPPPVNASPGQVAYKTGTSYGYRDAWAIGFDGRHVVGIWVGRPDGTPVAGLSGVVTAAPILFEAFNRVGARRTPLGARPSGTIAAANTAALPVPLRHFRAPGQSVFVDRDQPEIAYPLDGVAVDLGIRGRRPVAAGDQDSQRCAAVHLLRQRRADLPAAVRAYRRHGSPTDPASSRYRWWTPAAVRTA